MKKYLKYALLTVGLSFPLAAVAAGPGDYTVEGLNSDGTKYSGVASISKTGENIYLIKWNIDGDKYDGFAVGEDKFLAITFNSGKNVGAAFLADDDKGGYVSLWAFKGDKKAGTEIFSPKK